MNIQRRTIQIGLPLLIFFSLPTMIFSQSRKPPTGSEKNAVDTKNAESEAGEPALEQEFSEKDEVRDSSDPIEEEINSMELEYELMQMNGSSQQTAEPASQEPSVPDQRDQAESQTDEEVLPEQLPPQTIVEESPQAFPEGNKVVTLWIWQETGDSLWSLAKEHYGDPWQWKKIYLANRNTILDPNLVFPKQKIIIPSVVQK